MSSNYRIDSSKPAFSDIEDSTNPFLSNNGPKVYDPAQEEHFSVVQQIQQVEQRSLDSTKRSLKALAESEQIGVDVAENLVHQREQLVNTNKRLDIINEDLKESQKNIKAMKSVWSSLRQWMSRDKGTPSPKEKVAVPDGPSSPNYDHNPILEKAVNIAPNYPDPSLRLRGVDYDANKRYEGPVSQSSSGEDWKETSKKVNKQLDDDLDEMSFGLSRLKGLAEGLNVEITQQNSLLDDISRKAERADNRLGSTNKQINGILRK